jgi:hypothetical protein
LPYATVVLALGLALVALVAGLIATGRVLAGPREGALGAIGGLTGIVVGALILGYFVWILYHIGSNY